LQTTEGNNAENENKNSENSPQTLQ